MSRFVLLVVLPVLGLGACSQPDDAGTPEPPAVDHGRILPLAVGNRWYYRESLYDTSGVPIGVVRDTFAFVRDTTVAGIPWYVDRTGVLYGIRDGIAVLNMYPSDTAEALFLLYPVRDGLYEYDGPGGYRVSSLGMATTATITLPLGTFECLAYIFRARSRETLAIYATPDIGIIRVVSSGKIRELEGYDLLSVPPGGQFHPRVSF